MKSYKELSIRNKLILIILITSLIVLLIISGLFYFWELSYLKHEKLSRLTMTAKLIGESCVVPLTFDDTHQCRTTLEILGRNRHILKAQVFTANEEFFASYSRNEKEAFHIADITKENTRITSDRSYVKEEIIYKKILYGYIFLEAENSDLQKKIGTFTLILILLILSLIFVSILLAQYFQRLISKPIIQLASKVTEISEKGDFSLRVDKYYADETGALYDEFNKMFTQIEKRNRERKEAFDLLQQQHEMYLTIFNSYSEFVYVIDPITNRILFVNRRVKEDLGYDPTGQICFKVFYKRHSICDFCNNKELLDKKIIITREYNDETNNRYLLITDQLIRWTDGRDVRFEVAIDITERHQAEKEIEKLNNELEERVAERTKQLKGIVNELESFAYSVSHDLRTPLRTIDGFSQILIEDFYDQLDEEGKDYLKRVRKASQKMGTLIDDILKLSRISRFDLNVNETRLSEMAEEIAEELMKTDPMRKVNFIIEPEMTVLGDERLIKIALDNLFNNAWKYTSRNEISRIEFGCKTEEDKKIFYLKDNGSGFDMKYRNKLFLPFHRLHKDNDFPGTGIGLATVMRIILRHNGFIWAEGEPGKGATFYFNFGNHHAVKPENDTDN